MFAFGALAGMYALPFLADLLGRRPTINIAFVIQVFGIGMLIVGIYRDAFILMTVGHFLTGLFASGLTIISFVYTSEVCGDKMRQIGILIFCSSW
jgi:MFS family permease